MKQIINVVGVTLCALLRDRILHGLVGAVLLLLVLIPAFSLFSMRQVQELSITLTLSSVSFILLILAVLLGASSIWKDIEKRFAISVLGLPLSRTAFLTGKFFGICLFIEICCLLFGAIGLVAIYVASALNPSELPVAWGYVILALVVDSWKFFLLTSVALMFSAVSTSLFLPVFGTISIYFAGGASQEVYEFIQRDQGQTLPAMFVKLCQGLYYVLPNFALFDLKVQAVYGLPVSLVQVSMAAAYCFTYCGLVLILATWVFSRRELQ